MAGSNHPVVSLASIDFAKMQVGDVFYVKNTYSTDGAGGIDVYFRRLGPAEAEGKLADTRLKQQIGHSSPVTLDAYGTTCPRCCAQTLVECERYTTSDGFFGIERDEFVCSTVGCGVSRCCQFGGYGRVADLGPL